MSEGRLTTSTEGFTFVELGDRNIISVEHAAPDHVSRFIRALAFGMIVLGTGFAVLDWYGLLPQLPAATVAHDPSLNSGPESKGHG